MDGGLGRRQDGVLIMHEEGRSSDELAVHRGDGRGRNVLAGSELYLPPLLIR